MKKYLVILIVLLMMFSFLPGCSTKQLDGPYVVVHCLTAVEYGYKTATFSYDINGNLVAEHDGNDDDPTPKYLYEYHTNGRIKKWLSGAKTVLAEYNEDGNIVARYFRNGTTTYNYDESGVLRTSQHNFLSGSVSCSAYYYDANGILTREVSIHDKGIRFETVYDNSGNILLNLVMEGENEVRRTENQYTYDEKGNITRHYYNDKNTEWNTYYEWEYDSQGRPILRCRYQSDGELKAKTVWTYFTDYYEVSGANRTSVDAYYLDGRPMYLDYGIHEKKFIYQAIEVPESIVDQVLKRQEELIDRYDDDEWLLIE